MGLNKHGMVANDICMLNSYVPGWKKISSPLTGKSLLFVADGIACGFKWMGRSVHDSQLFQFSLAGGGYMRSKREQN